ncbi:MAG TPA: TonB-dependent receptor [Fluviicoccus sp.]|nr:TonB-dependent receptor [Fluviicoccus sp.]
MNASKTTIRRCTPHARLPLALSVCLLHAPGFADSLWDLPLEELGKMRITTIASGTETPLDKAAAIATVITADDIAAMGATDIEQALETVPGLHVGRGDQIAAPKFYIRGITSSFNAQTLVLINGIPITSLFTGNRSNVWSGMPVKSVARIEVIRGPGSALYGADAFSGVINIITKTGQDIRDSNGGNDQPHTIGGVRAGSFNTRSVWLEHGGGYGGFDVGLTLEAETTDGWKATVEADQQTAWDAVFGPGGAPAVSLAPGPINMRKDMVDARLEVARGSSRFRTGFQGRYHLGTGLGTAQALDPHGELLSQRVNADYTYTRNDLTPDWGLEARTSYYRGTMQVTEDMILFPKGAFGGAFPDGFIGNPEFREENARIDLSGVYKGLERHRVRLGTGFYWGDMFEVTESKNFDVTFAPRPGGLEDVSDTPEAFLPEAQRTNTYAFLQDEWKMAEDWLLTSGIRYDHYSDFGNSVNPRMALVWAATDNMTTRLLYGSAFRAPAFVESAAASNPVALGNPDLKPEKIDTYELAFSHHISTDLLYTANMFYYQIKDMIDFVPNGLVKQAQNIGRRKGRGFELEMDYTVIPDLRLLVNYSYQQSIDKNNGTDVGESPNQEFYGRCEWTPAPFWRLDTQLTRVGPQKRAAGDNRAALAGYTTVDVSVRKKKVWNTLSLSLSVHNLFDADVREPSPGPIAPLTVPHFPRDLPMAGRTVSAEASYSY